MSEVTTGRRHTDNPRLLRPEGEWHKYEGGVYRCMVYVAPEETGVFSVIAAYLPGVASQGDSEREALANITEALTGAIRIYKELGQEVPWTKTPVDHERGALERWVVVHA